ncbi:MAG: DUF4400 domain-containing protein [Methylococcaceae bacterium]|nr:DUF4400 domain-containing protein [Methylococcaceae bacterium]
MPRNILLSVMVWILEVVLVTALVSDQWLKTVERTEARLVVDYFGAHKDLEIRVSARYWFNHLFVETGVRAQIHHYFIPTEQERQQSYGFEDFGRDTVFAFIESRLIVLWDSVYQMMHRGFLLLAWWPFLAAAAVPFAVDGLVRRKIKQSNFDYTSPLAHRYSFYAILGTLYVLLLGLTLPFPVPPQAMPAGCIAIALALSIYFAHTQKRI